MEVFDFNDVSVVVDGIVITGYAEGSAIKAGQKEDNFTSTVGADGSVAIAENNNKTGEITIAVKNTSPSNEYLLGLANSKKIIPVQIVDLNDYGMKAGGTQCRITKPPEAEWSNKSTNREYKIFVGDYKQTT